MFHFLASSMRGKRLSDDIVRAIYIKRDLQLSIHEIAVDLGISIKAVQNAINPRPGNRGLRGPVGWYYDCNCFIKRCFTLIFCDILSIHLRNASTY
jgi:hypothetical protein